MSSPEFEVSLNRRKEIKIDPRGVELLGLVGRRFDMPNKKRIVSLYEKIGKEILNSALTEKEFEVLSVYPRDKEGRFLSGEKAAIELGRRPGGGHYLIKEARWLLAKVGWRLVIGERAIETLKLPDFLYDRADGLGIRRIDQIVTLPEKRIGELCGSRFGLEVLKEKMVARGIDWSPPEIEFELLPSKPGY